jgi:hypothetical protein
VHRAPQRLPLTITQSRPRRARTDVELAEQRLAADELHCPPVAAACPTGSAHSASPPDSDPGRGHNTPRDRPHAELRSVDRPDGRQFLASETDLPACPGGDRCEWSSFVSRWRGEPEVAGDDDALGRRLQSRVSSGRVLDVAPTWQKCTAGRDERPALRQLDHQPSRTQMRLGHRWGPQPKPQYWSHITFAAPSAPVSTRWTPKNSQHTTSDSPGGTRTLLAVGVACDDRT